LLTAKLQILTGTGNRRPSLALGILTGRSEHLSLVPPTAIDAVAEIAEVAEPVSIIIHMPTRPRYAARTVYMTERHLRAVDEIIDAWQQVGSRRLTRSAVLRRAIDHLRTAVHADPAKSLLENE